MDQRTYENLWSLVGGARDLITPDNIEDAINEAGAFILDQEEIDMIEAGGIQLGVAPARVQALDLASKHCQYQSGATVTEVAQKFLAFLNGDA